MTIYYRNSAIELFLASVMSFALSKVSYTEVIQYLKPII